MKDFSDFPAGLWMTVRDSAAEPYCKPGDQVYAHEGSPAAPGDGVLIRLADGTMIVRRLESQDETTVWVRRFDQWQGGDWQGEPEPIPLASGVMVQRIRERYFA